MTQESMHPLIARVIASDLMVEPTHLGQLKANLIALCGDEKLSALASEPRAEGDFWPAPGDWLARYRPYVVKDGVLQIPVSGVLLNDYPFTTGGATGYDYIWEAYKRGMDDSGVRGIALVVNSGGGMVSGNFDLVDRMFERRDEKPVWGFACDAAYSAAYNIISIAQKVTVTRSGGVGSIGVVTGHWDESKFWEDMGLKHTYIFAGQHKVDGNPYESLPENVRARIQSRIDELYTEFVASVARNRGLDDQAVRDTEALTFTAKEAVSNGLADEIGSLEDALAAFMADLNEGDETMSQKENQASEEVAAMIKAARDEGLTAGRLEGSKAEKERFGAVLGLEESATRRASAINFAVKTDLSVETVQGLLKDIPADAAQVAVDPAPKADNAFRDAMNKTENPDLGSGGEGGPSADSDEAKTAAILADYRRATGASKAS